VFSFDPVGLLSYAAAVTNTIRLGASVIVLPVQHPVRVAHQWATLDYISHGRAILGIGIGREHHYRQFDVLQQSRVPRFREQVELIRELWTGQTVTHRGRFYQLDDAMMVVKPVQKPHPPIWMGVGHADALRRAASIADGWMGSGGSTIAAFQESVPLLRDALVQAGRDPKSFPISKRIFIAVDERPQIARAELQRWFTEVYRDPPGTDASGIYGTPEQVRERLEQVVAMGANHLLLNPVSRYVEQVEALAEVVGLR
jgi:probable F420-dependent oxidoreductase